MEYAQNKLGLPDALHAEDAPEAPDHLIVPLALPMQNARGKILLRPNSKAAAWYGQNEVMETHNCRFGLNRKKELALDAGGFKISGVDEQGAARILELPEHPFYVATLFQPQASSTPQKPHPLILAYLRVVRAVKDATA